MKKRILSCLMALALCLTLLPTAALAEEMEGTAQTSPAVEESKDPANGEAKQEGQSAAPAEGTGHTHPICGDVNCTKHGESFSNWKGVNALTAEMEAGHYYLTQNVKIDSTWEPKNGVVLCLNGNSITATGDFNAIKVKDNTFTLCDCGGGGKITHAEGKTGIGVEVINGTFIMHGGSITGNRNTKDNPYGKGGGVMVASGAFEMHGGSITDNSVSGDRESCGGGVFVNSNCRFTMDGGSITGNTATGSNSSGGGVYVSQDGTFTVSGKVNITGNKCKYSTVSNDSNVFLPFVDQSLKSFTIGNGGLTSDSKIGVATDVAPNPGHYLTVATLSKGAVYIEGTIISDRTDGCAIKGNGNNIILYNGELHAHPICGKSCTHNGTHSDAVWKPISSETELRNAQAGGHYYLTKGIDLYNNAWEPKDGVVLCLNGQSITAKGSFDAIEVGNGVTFTLTDCSSQRNGEIAHGEKDQTGCGVKVLTGGTFKMYDGWIARNTVNSNSGGGVYVIGGTFEMHGGNIGGNKANYGGGVSVVADSNGNGGTFKMYDGCITDNTANGTSGAYGGGVYVSDSGSAFEMSGSASITQNKANGKRNRGGGVYMAGGTFTMTGGASITENWAYANDGGGGGVYVSGGIFNMNGGTIERNTAAASGGGVGYEGGGVYVAGGTFTMTGGAKISGNTATSNGGGVYVTGVDSKFTVSGKVNVTDNHESYGTNTTDNNVYLHGGKHITIGGSGLDARAKIGVICASLAPGESYTVATGATNEALEYAKIFIPDEADRGYVITEDGTNLVLSAHQHSWTYALKENSTDTITATCANCPLKNGSTYDGGSVTIKAPAPTNLDYDGTPKAAKLDSTLDSSISTPDIMYQQGDAVLNNEAPTDAGTYTASITRGGVTASVTYTIRQAYQEYKAPRNVTAVYGNTLADVTLPDGWTWEDKTTKSVGTVGEHTFKATYTPSDPNYKAVSGIYVTVTVNKAPVTISITGMPEGPITYGDTFVLTITQTGASNAVPANWTKFSHDKHLKYLKEESHPEEGKFKFQAIGFCDGYGCSGKFTVEFESETHKGSLTVDTPKINKKTLTEKDLHFGGLATDFTKVYDGNTSFIKASVEISTSAKVNAGDTLPEVKGSYVYNSANVQDANKVTFTSEETVSENYILPAGLKVEHTAKITKANQATLTVHCRDLRRRSDADHWWRQRHWRGEVHRKERLW